MKRISLVVFNFLDILLDILMYILFIIYKKKAISKRFIFRLNFIRKTILNPISFKPKATPLEMKFLWHKQIFTNAENRNDFLSDYPLYIFICIFFFLQKASVRRHCLCRLDRRILLSFSP